MALYGHSDASLLLFLDLAELSPDLELRSELISAAGFDTTPEDTLAPVAPPPVPAEARPDTTHHQRKQAAAAMSDRPHGTTSSPDTQSRAFPTTTAISTPDADAGDRSPHGAPAPLFTGSPSADSVPQQVPNSTQTGSQADRRPAGSDNRPEESLAALGFNPELWGGDAEDARGAAGKGPKRKRSERRAAEGAAAGRAGRRGRPSALSLLDDSGAAAAGGTAAAAGRSVVYWIRQDLRLHDNPALCRAARLAAAAGGKVLCVYVHSPGAHAGVARHGRCDANSPPPPPR